MKINKLYATFRNTRFFYIISMVTMKEKRWQKSNSVNDMQTNTNSIAFQYKSINQNITLD